MLKIIVFKERLAEKRCISFIFEELKCSMGESRGKRVLRQVRQRSWFFLKTFWMAMSTLPESVLRGLLSKVGVNIQKTCMPRLRD